MLIQNKGYALGLALARSVVSYIRRRWLRSSILDKDLLLILLNYLLVLQLAHGHKLYQLVIYMHEMMMQHLVIWQQQLLT